ncbi:MAG: hypothetical protein JWQ38_3755 [Flavipsychrobacter sp.]|nr:hypothetical protein [Flavipsychrobacter sp.]
MNGTREAHLNVCVSFCSTDNLPTAQINVPVNRYLQFFVR